MSFLDLESFACQLHAQLCGDAAGCSRYREGSRHYGYYQDKARALVAELEPLTGAAAVPAVVFAVIEELW